MPVECIINNSLTAMWKFIEHSHSRVNIMFIPSKAAQAEYFKITINKFHMQLKNTLHIYGQNVDI